MIDGPCNTLFYPAEATSPTCQLNLSIRLYEPTSGIVMRWRTYTRTSHATDIVHGEDPGHGGIVVVAQGHAAAGLAAVIT